MNTLTGTPAAVTTGWYTAEDCHLEDLRAIVEVSTDPADYPHADEVVQNVLIYGPGLADHVGSEVGRRASNRQRPALRAAA